MITLLKSSDISVYEWQHLVDRSVNASYFQTKACYDFYCQLSFLKPFLYAVSENGQLKALVCGYVVADGGMVKSFFSRRAIAPGGVLLDESVSEQALTLLLTTLKLSRPYILKSVIIPTLVLSEIVLRNANLVINRI